MWGLVLVRGCLTSVSVCRTHSKGKKKAPEEEPLPPDADIVLRVSRMMKTNKLSQVQVGQEARVSQAVISQWLARKYASTRALQHKRWSGICTADVCAARRGFSADTMDTTTKWTRRWRTGWRHAATGPWCDHCLHTSSAN